MARFFSCALGGALAVTAGLACVGDLGCGDGLGPKAGPTTASAQLAGVSGLRRLTSDEYDNTIRDLLGDKTRASALLLPTEARTPFDNDYTHQIASQALIEGVETLATEAAAR